MRFLAALICLLGMVAAAPLQARVPSVTAAIIEADITALDISVKALTSTIQGFTGGFLAFPQLAPITAAFGAVHLTNRKGYYDALAITSPLSISDSQAIIALVAKTLDVDNPAAVKITKSKKPLFDQSGLSPVILSALQTLLADHLSYSAALTKWVAPSEKANAAEVVATITTALQNGVAYYS